MYKVKTMHTMPSAATCPIIAVVKLACVLVAASRRGPPFQMANSAQPCKVIAK